MDEVDLLDHAFHGAATERRSALDLLLLGDHLIEQSTDTDLTVTLKKMLADHHSYLAEITHDDANHNATENARLTYREAAAIARATLPSHSNIRRGMEIERYHRG